MKKRIIIALLIIGLAVLCGIIAAGQSEPQQWLDPNDIAFELDPNIANYIVAIRLEAGVDEEFRIEQGIETHLYPVTVSFSGLPAGARAEGKAFCWLPTAEQVGTHYFTVSAMDNPPFYVRSRTITGTWAVQVVPNNPGPTLIPFVR